MADGAQERDPRREPHIGWQNESPSLGIEDIVQVQLRLNTIRMAIGITLESLKYPLDWQDDYDTIANNMAALELCGFVTGNDERDALLRDLLFAAKGDVAEMRRRDFEGIPYDRISYYQEVGVINRPRQ